MKVPFEFYLQLVFHFFFNKHIFHSLALNILTHRKVVDGYEFVIVEHLRCLIIVLIHKYSNTDLITLELGYFILFK